MLYKKNCNKVITRLENFYSGGGKGSICAQMKMPNSVIDQMKREMKDGPVSCPDLITRADFWDKVLSLYADLEDDSIPGIYLTEIDQGLDGGMLGGEPHFILDTSSGWISSMVPPFAESAEDIYKYEIDLTNKWYRFYDRQLSIYREKAAGKFGVSHFCSIDGLHLLAEMRGFTETFYEVIDNPGVCKDIITFAYKLALILQNRFFEVIGQYEGGTCSNMAQWLPGRCISDSVDIYHLANADLFEEWGREPLQKFIDNFDGAVLHIHSNGRHLIEHISSIKNLKVIYLADDEWATPFYLDLNELDHLRRDVPYVVSIPFEAFTDMLMKKELLPNVFYMVNNVPDIETANLLMKDVVAYRV